MGIFSERTLRQKGGTLVHVRTDETRVRGQQGDAPRLRPGGLCPLRASQSRGSTMKTTTKQPLPGHSTLSERWSNARRRSVTCKARAQWPPGDTHGQGGPQRAVRRGTPWPEPGDPGALPVGITLFAIGRTVMAQVACNSDSVIVPGKIRAPASSS
jgi:hypothetical protein